MPASAIAIRFQLSPDENLVAHRLPDFANSIYATTDYIARHSFSGSNPTARWIALGGKEVLASWRQDSLYSICKVHHIVSDMSAQLNAVKAGMGQTERSAETAVFPNDDGEH